MAENMAMVQKARGGGVEESIGAAAEFLRGGGCRGGIVTYL